MFGISGTALGAILRAKGRSYKEIFMVALVYAIVMLLISIVVLSLTTITVFELSWIPEGWVISTTFIGTVLGVILICVSAFVSMILGAVILDATEAIIKGMR